MITKAHKGTRGGLRVVLLALAGLASLPFQRTDDRRLFAFVHVTVIDGTEAAPKPDQTVVVADDRIVAVGPSRSVPIPRRARALDATGRFLIPGLWDSHVHTRYEGIDHLRLADRERHHQRSQYEWSVAASVGAPRVAPTNQKPRTHRAATADGGTASRRSRHCSIDAATGRQHR